MSEIVQTVVKIPNHLSETYPKKPVPWTLTDNEPSTRGFDETEFLVYAGGNLTTLTRRKLSGQLNYSERNYV